MTNRIDNPLDVAFSQLLDAPETSVSDIMLKLVPLIGLTPLVSLTPLITGVTVFDKLRDQFSNRRRVERIRELLFVFKAEFEARQNAVAANTQKVEAIWNVLQTSQFAEALMTAAEEAVRSPNSGKIKRLGSVLANGSDPEINSSMGDDLTSFIRDVSFLSEVDIHVLESLKFGFGPGFAVTESQKAVSAESPLRAFDDAVREQLLTDDLHSHCFRLVGFGLAAQIPSNSPSATDNKTLFRVTKRGHTLLALLKQRT